MKHTTKTMQALDMLDNYELADMLTILREDVNDVLTIRTFGAASTRSETLTLLAKANLIRKYGAWVRKHDGKADIAVVYSRNDYRIEYTYDCGCLEFRPLPPSTRFDRECRCWQCHRLVRAYVKCRETSCNAYLCEDCNNTPHDSHCPTHRLTRNGYKPAYYKPVGYHKFTFGLEIETERKLGEKTELLFRTSPLIAGWVPDCSLPHDALEYQTQPLTMADIPALQALITRLPFAREGKAGGHMHVSRTHRQTPGRWYWALEGLTGAQAIAFNMRHADGRARWCELVHGEYTGKHTAINAEHANTLELRTFDAWDKTTASRLPLAAAWVHQMWRLFESAKTGTLKIDTIRLYARRVATDLLTPPPASLDTRLAAYKHKCTVRRNEQRKEIRQHVMHNISLSRTARFSHGKYDVGESRRQAERSYRRHCVQERLTSRGSCYIFPSDRHYSAKVAKFALAQDWIDFTVYNPATGYPNSRDLRDKMARHVARNIMLSRQARLSHEHRPDYTEKQLLQIVRRMGVTVTRQKSANIRYVIA